MRTVILCLLVLALGAWLGWRLHPAATPSPTGKATPEVPAVSGGEVKLTPEQLQQGDIQIAEVQLRPLSSKLRATGSLVADPDQQYRVSTALGGRVVQLRVGVGARVQAGQVVAAINSPELTRALADYHHAKIRAELAHRTLEQKKRLLQLGDESRRPVEEARLEQATDQAEYRSMQTKRELAERTAARVRVLYREGVDSRQQLDEAEAALAEARAVENKARVTLGVAEGHRTREEEVNRLGLLSAPKIAQAETDTVLADEEVHHSADILRGWGVDPGSPEENLLVRAPRDGLVDSRSVTLGESVNADQLVLTIVDPSKLWLWIDLYEQDLAGVKVGDPVVLRVKAYPKRTFRGRVGYLEPSLDPATRTLRARVEVNPEGRLRAGMYADVELELGRQASSLAVPSTAIQVMDLPGGRQPVVYRQLEPGHFQRVPVKTGWEQDGWSEIKAGLEAGQKVASSGVILIKSEDLRSQWQGED